MGRTLHSSADNPVTRFFDILLAATLLRLIPRHITPNQMTIFRFILTPFVVYLITVEALAWGGILFAIAALSDALDGARARTRNQITEWGTLYDPIADKVLVSSVAAIAVTRYLSPLLALAIIGLEALLVMGAYIRRRAEGNTVVSARWSGKAKMIAQSAGLIFLFVYLAFASPIFLTLATYTLYGAVGLALISLVVYRSV